MIVLQVGAFPFPHHQGSQVYVAGMCRALVRAGVEVHLATYGGAAEGWPPGVHPVPVALELPRPTRSGPSPWRPPWDLVLALAVARVLRSRPVDVVHAHNVEAPLVGALAQLLARRRVPLVYDLHTTLADELPTYVEGRVARRVAAASGAVIDRLLPRIADASLAISPAGATHLAASGAAVVWEQPPGVDVADVRGGDGARARAAWGLGSGPWVLYTGNTDAYQDLDLLYAAMARLPPDTGLLVVTADAPARVLDPAAAAGLDRTRIRVVRDDGLDTLRDVIAAATVGAVPRRVCAGFPIKLLNLVAAGLPTVTTPGTAQPIAGVVVGGDTPAGFAAALRTLIDDPAGRARLSATAVADVDARWTWARRADELVARYASLRRG